MGYVAVRGGGKAIEESLKLLEYQRVNASSAWGTDEIEGTFPELVDQVMGEASLYAPRLAALARRGRVPAARVPLHAGAPLRVASGGHGRHAREPPRVGRVQGRARRPGAGCHARLQPPSAGVRPGNRGRRRAGREARRTGRPLREGRRGPRGRARRCARRFPVRGDPRRGGLLPACGRPAGRPYEVSRHRRARRAPNSRHPSARAGLPARPRLACVRRS